jgi:hypothetical protein
MGNRSLIVATTHPALFQAVPASVGKHLLRKFGKISEVH